MSNVDIETVTIEVEAQTADSVTIDGVVGLQAALDAKVDKVTGKGLSTNDYTTAEKTKLAGIEEGAEVNPTKVSELENDAGYLTEHQSLAAYRTAAAQDVIDAGKVDKETGKGLSTNDYTTAEKTKLAGVETGAQKNPTNVSAFLNDAGYLTEHQSLSAYRTSVAQDVIDSGKVDKVTGKGLSTEDYTTAEKTKLSGIETGAEKNPELYLKNATVANNKLTITKQDDTTIEFQGGQSSMDWDNITNKPSTFPPSTHTHAQSEVTGLTTALAEKQDKASIVDFDTVTTQGEAYTLLKNCYDNGLTGILELNILSIGHVYLTQIALTYTAAGNRKAICHIIFGRTHGTLEAEENSEEALDPTFEVLATEDQLDSYRTSAAQDVIDAGKVDKVTGKGLSTEDYTTAEKTKLSGIEEGAEVNEQSDWSVNDSTADGYIKNRTHYDTLVQPEYTEYTWDGTTTGKEHVLFGEMDLYKLASELPYSITDIFGVYCFFDFESIHAYNKVVDLHEMEPGVETGKVYISSELFIALVPADCTILIDGESISMSKGVWALCSDASQGQYVKDIKLYKNVSGTHTDYTYDGDTTGKTVIEGTGHSEKYVKISDTYPEVSEIVNIGVGEVNSGYSYSGLGLVEVTTGVYSESTGYHAVLATTNATVDGYSFTPGVWAKFYNSRYVSLVSFHTQTDSVVQLASKYIPTATASSVGGIKASAATATDTQEVKIGTDGKLYTAQGGVTSVDGRTGAVTVFTSGTGSMPSNVSLFVDENTSDIDMSEYRKSAAQDVIDAGKEAVGKITINGTARSATAHTVTIVTNGVTSTFTLVGVS